MRIAYVCADPGVPVFGQKGCSVHVQEVMAAMAARGARVELFAARFGGEPFAIEHIGCHQLARLPKGDVGARERAALAANSALHSSLCRAGPFDIVYERHALWSFAAMEYAANAGTPALLEVNSPLLVEQAEYRALVDRRGARVAVERAFAAATALLAVSEELANYLNEFTTARGRVHVVPNGVNPHRFPLGLVQSHPALHGEFTVGFIGTLKPWHGLSQLVEAFAQLHQKDRAARMLIVGDGPERASLAEDVSRRGLDDMVQFVGAVAPDQVPRLLASMDVAVAPYPDFPHFYFSPLKVYEYLAAGLPVVASRIGQVAEVIEDGVNGLLYNPGDTGGLVGALERLRREPSLRTRLGQAGRSRVMRHHTWDRVIQRIFQLAERGSTCQPVAEVSR